MKKLKEFNENHQIIQFCLLLQLRKNKEVKYDTRNKQYIMIFHSDGLHVIQDDWQSCG